MCPTCAAWTARHEAQHHEAPVDVSDVCGLDARHEARRPTRRASDASGLDVRALKVACVGPAWMLATRPSATQRALKAARVGPAWMLATRPR